MRETGTRDVEERKRDGKDRDGDTHVCKYGDWGKDESICNIKKRQLLILRAECSRPCCLIGF